MINHNKGFTFIEVIMSLVIMSLVVIMLSNAVVSYNNISYKLYEAPNYYYKTQDIMEKDISKLKNLIEEKYQIENEIINLPDEKVDEEMVSRLEKINLELNNYDKESITVFGINVDVFNIKAEYILDEKIRLFLNGGVANYKKLKRPVPIIDNVEIKDNDMLTDDIYFGENKIINTEVNYNSKNYEYYFKNKYQWYIATDNFHTTKYLNDDDYEEPIYGTLVAEYPGNFTLISSANSESIKIENSFYGKYIACVVTPLSIGGAMGSPMISNYIYISNLPKLQEGNYEMIIDPSLTYYDYNPSGLLEIERIKSRNSIDSELISTGELEPTVNLHGEPTWINKNEGYVEGNVYSRFISFRVNTSMESDRIYNFKNRKIFIVAKYNSEEEVDFIQSGEARIGFINNNFISIPRAESKWRIIQGSLEDDILNFELGDADIDVAELIVVSNPSNIEILDILNYLSSKYKISLD